ncbi:MAG: tetratricopeptide repeat protein, partial [Melioribacteraceae bacterium]|nr:tetratricopeptide repeat protein [Melioribacteraceae bacterium]
KATKEIEAQNYSKALELLPTAIEKYPTHATAYFMYALALAHNEQIELAKEYISKGDDILKDENTKDHYLKLIEKIGREAAGISINFDDTVNEILEESFLEPEEFDPLKDIELLDDSLIDEEPEVEQHFEQNSIVTETLAEIYASQGNYEEALEIYEKLKDIKPELTEKFENRITELNLVIENKKQKRFGN